MGNIKSNMFLLPNGLSNLICLEGLGLFLFGLSPKRNKKNTLCDLCALRWKKIYENNLL